MDVSHLIKPLGNNGSEFSRKWSYTSSIIVTTQSLIKNSNLCAPYASLRINC